MQQAREWKLDIKEKEKYCCPNCFGVIATEQKEADKFLEN